MPEIFVSYRRTDAPGHAGRLYDRLVGVFGEENVFKDVDSLEPGADFVEVIENTIAHCDALIAVIGPGWLSQRLDDPLDWVRLEVGNALERGIRVIPVLVQGAAMPLDADLPDNLKALTRKHGETLNESTWSVQVSQLVNRLERNLVRNGDAPDAKSIHERAPEHQAATAQEPQPPRQASRTEPAPLEVELNEGFPSDEVDALHSKQRDARPLKGRAAARWAAEALEARRPPPSAIDPASVNASRDSPIWEVTGTIQVRVEDLEVIIRLDDKYAGLVPNRDEYSSSRHDRDGVRWIPPWIEQETPTGTGWLPKSSTGEPIEDGARVALFVQFHDENPETEPHPFGVRAI